jgi:GNAT superfamily N-acetyltransferase
MTTHEMLRLVQSQLATDMNCTINDLNGEKDSFIFTEVKDNPSRRPFPRSEQHFEMLSMGKSIVVSASPKILEIVKPLLDGKGRDEAFSMPFVYGHSLYYLPDLPQIKPLISTDGFAYEIVEQSEIPLLYRHEGFRNAVQYDVNHPRPDILVMLAKKDGRIAGMAGASSDCAMMWQVGMDVLPEYRNHGLATYLVNRLTLEILERGYVPYFGTASSNIASQRVAHRAGYFPAWVCAYKGKFDGLECSPTS